MRYYCDFSPYRDYRYVYNDSNGTVEYHYGKIYEPLPVIQSSDADFYRLRTLIPFEADNLVSVMRWYCGLYSYIGILECSRKLSVKSGLFLNESKSLLFGCQMSVKETGYIDDFIHKKTFESYGFEILYTDVGTIMLYIEIPLKMGLYLYSLRGKLSLIHQFDDLLCKRINVLFPMLSIVRVEELVYA